MKERGHVFSPGCLLCPIFVGYPGMGKSSAIVNGCLKPMENILQDDSKCCLLGPNYFVKLSKTFGKEWDWLHRFCLGVRCSKQTFEN